MEVNLYWTKFSLLHNEFHLLTYQLTQLKISYQINF